MLKMTHLPKCHGPISPMANCIDWINSSGSYRILLFFSSSFCLSWKKSLYFLSRFVQLFTIIESCPWPSRLIPHTKKGYAHTWSSRKALNSSQIPSSKYVYLLYLIGNIRSNGQQLNFRFSSWIHHYICWNINYNAFEQTAPVKKGCADKFRVPLSSSFVQIKKARETRTQ